MKSATTTPTAMPSPTASPVMLQFLGNSCTLITAPDNTRIVSDPYDNASHSTGLKKLPNDLEAEVVTISHTHSDHNNAKAVKGDPQIITEPGSYQISMVKITSYEGREGSPSGPSEMRNNIVVIEAAGVKIVHLGDSGPVTAPEVMEGIQDADLIIVNIDGYVIPPEKLLPFMQQIRARTILPGHYSDSTSSRWAGAPTIDEFLATLPSDLVVVRMGSEIQVTPGMPNQIAVLTALMLRK